METPMPGSAVYEFTPYRLVPAQRQLVRDGTPVKLGGRAFDVLVALVERRERTVSKNELMEVVWPNVVVEENNLEVQIVTLRKLLGYAAIATVPGRGYRFASPVSEEGTSPSTLSPAPPQAALLHSRLPVTASALYGRDDDVRALRRIMQEHPVVTVAGAGGIGKTRLAQSVLHEHQELTGSACWVELASLTDPALIPTAVAHALGVPVNDHADPTLAVVDALRGRAALLVLDNAEHLLDGVAAFISTVRRDAAGVRLLITSQEVLHTLDEHVFRPGPLRLPATDDLASARASGAVALFVARAQAVDSRFELTENNRAAVVDICRHLDGIPLAIELAAARVPLLGVQGVAQRLDDRFNVLTAGRRAVLRRHQTLRAALEWSHGLLSPPEQAAFRRLSVFAADFSVEAAQSVVSDDNIDSWDVLEHMGALVDKSLLVADGELVPRYRLLETTRLYALERLAEAEETAALLLRHARHYTELAEAQERVVADGGPRANALAVLDAERDNLLHALAWCERDGSDESTTLGLQMAGVLHYFWTSRGLMRLGSKFTRSLLHKASQLPPDTYRLRALTCVASLLERLNEHEEALAWAHDHVMLADQFGDRKALATALSSAGCVAVSMKRMDEGRNYLLRALEEARAIGDLISQCKALTGLGRIEHEQGRLVEGAALAEEILKVARGAKDPHAITICLFNAATAWLWLDEPERARTRLSEAATLVFESDSRYLGQLLIDNAATMSALARDWPQAARLLGAAGALERASDRSDGRLVSPREEELHAQARSALGFEAYDKALKEGARMAYTEAIRLASAVLQSPAETGQDCSIQLIATRGK